MKRGLEMGITQPHNLLKTWQGPPFYLAKRVSGPPLGTNVVPVVWACQTRIDMTCQNGHVKIAPKLWAWNASDRRSDFASLRFCRTLSGYEVPAMSCAGQGLLSAASRWEHGWQSQPATDPLPRSSATCLFRYSVLSLKSSSGMEKALCWQSWEVRREGRLRKTQG